MKASQMIPIPLVIATAIIGFMLFTGDIPQPVPQTSTQPLAREGQAQAIAPLLPNIRPYKCASWMDADTCARLKASCGNGVCDAHERCNTCAFDCGCGGAQVCNTETGQCHSPAGVCNAPRGG